MNTRPRVEANGVVDARSRGIDLREEAERLMRGMAEAPSSGRLTLTLQALNQLGEDELARNMWTYGEQQQTTDAASAAMALGPLFRMQDRAAFARAYRLVRRPTRLQRDMLWQVLGPSLADSTDDDVLLLLESNVTGPTPSGYIEVLGPQLARRWGNPRVAGLIQRAARSASAGQEKQRLEGLLRQYSTGR